MRKDWPSILIRHETEADHRAVEELTREAFWNLHRPGCDEHYTTHLIRNTGPGDAQRTPGHPHPG